MTDSSTDVSSSFPEKTQITPSSLEGDEQNCALVVLKHARMLPVYISAQISLVLETFYTYLGLLVGSWPLSTIMVTLLFGAVLCTGLAYFKPDTSYETWIPTSASALDHRDWVRQHFREDYRLELATVSIKGNISQSFSQTEYLARLAEAQYEITNLTVYIGHRMYTFEDLCYREGTECFVDSPLNSIFHNTNPDSIREELTSEESNLALFNIFHVINPVDFDQLFGLVRKDSDGRVESIKATTLQFRIRGDQNFSEAAEIWENLFISWSEKYRNDSLDISVFTSDTVEEETQEAFGNDIILLSCGYLLTFIYFALFLGKFNRKEHKIWIAVVGILCISFTLVVAAGLASYIRFSYGPVHSVIPFLLLGIGVDDMFVIVSSWQSSKPPKAHTTSKYSSVARYTAKCLGAVGVSMTVTSITNAVAFFVGAGTVLPSLSSFCVYAGLAILLLFFFQVTFFAAFVAIDYRRQQANLDAGFPFIKLPPVKITNERKKLDLASRVREVFSSHIGGGLAGTNVASRIIQLLVIVLAGVIFAFCGYGCSKLEIEIDIKWLFHPDSYAVKFIDQRMDLFPGSGIPVAVYTGEIDYFSQQPELHLLNHTLYTDPSLRMGRGAVVFWFDKFIRWIDLDGRSMLVDFNSSSPLFPTRHETQRAIRQAGLSTLPIIINSTQFYTFLCEFVRNPISSEVRGDFEFDEEGSGCGNCCIKATRGHATFVPLNTTKEELEAMDGLRSRVNAIPFSYERAFAYAEIFLSWETNYVIEDELVRNVIIAIVVIFLVTLLLVADWLAACLVFLAVALTMVDIAGSLYYLGLSINTVTAVLLVLVVGLSVDYAAHVVYAFMRATGSRKERVRAMLADVGPPVLNGGISTLLAFALLVFSKSYIFQAFFKVFTGVVLFGLFHGLLFLPVLLGLIGPGSNLAHFKSKISEQLEIDDSSCDASTRSPLDNVNSHFDVESYEHHANMMRARVSPAPPPTEKNLDLLLYLHKTLASDQTLDVSSICDNSSSDVQISNVIQESDI